LNIYMLYEEDNPDAWTLLGRAYYQLGEDFEAALEAFDQAIDLDPELLEAFLYRGLTNIALDQGQEAVNDLFEARNSFPESFEINLAFGQALFASERYEDAYAQINASLAYTNTLSDTAAVFYWNALSLEALERQAEADQNWLALTELPEDVVPEEWLILADERLRTPTATPTITQTLTSTATATATATPKPTSTLTPSPSYTPTPPPTETRSPTSSFTPSSTRTPTRTLAPTGTSTPTPIEP
jgi:tetratricopeptide (TPR) repeat protein